MKQGDAFISREFRPINKNGNCVWCAAETVFWGGAGYEQFKGIRDHAVKEGWHGAGIENVLSACKDAEIEYYYTNDKRDTSVLEYGVRNGTGFYFQISGHALVGVGYDKDPNGSVRVINNYGNRVAEVEVWSRKRFDREWDGNACCPRKIVEWIMQHRPHPTINPTPKPTPDPKVEPKPDPKPDPKPVPGKDGKDGKPGKDGIDGKPGKDGVDGKPGKDVDPARLAALEAAITDLQKALAARDLLIADLEKKFKDLKGVINITVTSPSK